MQTSSSHTTALTTGFALATMLGLAPAYAINYDFDNGGGTGDWNLNTNWNPDGLPTTVDNVFVVVAGAATKTITLSATPVNPVINEVGLARSGDGSATVNQTGGTLTVQSWFNLGQGAAAAGNNGTGVWNMGGTSVLNATHSAGGQSVIGVGFTSSPNYNSGILTLSDSAQFLQTANEIRIGGETAATRANGSVTLNNSSVLSHTGGGQFWVGVGANGSTGSLNLHDSASLTTAGGFELGRYAGASGSVLQDGTSTLTANGGWLAIGGDGMGTYTMNGGTLTFTGSQGLNVGDRAGSSGTFLVNAGQVNVTGATTPDLNLGKTNATGVMTVGNNAQVIVNRNVNVGNGGTSTGALTLNNNASLSAAGLFLVGVSSTAAGTVVQNDASTVTINGAYANIGGGGGGTYTMNGGTLTFTGAFGLNVGDGAGSHGTFTANGGQVNVNGATSPDLFIGKTSATGTMTLNNSAQVVVNRNLQVGYSGTSSGTLNVNNNASVTTYTLMVWDSAGTINVNGGSLTATGWITLGQYTGAGVMNHNAGNVTTPQVWTTFNSSGTYNLNGGTLSTGLFTKGSGNSVMNFNGGTLKATAAFTLGGGNVTTAQVRNGGAILDSNGQDISVSQDLIHSGIGGDASIDGGLTKTGAGTLTLSGVNSYTGTTTVSQGRLLVTGSTDTAGMIHVSPLATLGGSGSVGAVTVAGDGILSPGATASNHFTMQDLTLGNTSVLDVELDAPSPGVTLDSDYLMVSGNLVLDGVLMVSKRTVPGFGTPVLGDKWLLMNVGGSITDQGLTVAPSAPALSPGLAYAIETDTSVPGFSGVYLAVVPEPGTAGLMILAALLLGRRARA